MTRLVRIPLFPMLVVIAALTGGEYFFMLLGTASPLDYMRGTGIYETSNLLERMVNDTIETLMKTMLDAGVKKEELSSILERLKVVEDKLQTTDGNVADDDKMKTHAGTSMKEDLVSLGERVSLFESKIKTYEDESVKKEDLDTLREMVLSVEKKFHGLTNTLSLVSSTNSFPNEPSYGSNNETFCVLWSENMDAWWTHHVDWFVSQENETHYCFSPMEDLEKAEFFRNLYNIQFKGDCSNVTTKRTWNSGWGADLRNVVDGLQHAVETKTPTQMYTPNYWHYAATKERMVCPAADYSCFFLNMSRCEPNPDGYVHGGLLMPKAPFFTNPGSWYLEYATRQQTWLRKKVHRFSTNRNRVNITTPCTVIHARRSDVVLHSKRSRRYHEIGEYVKALDNSTNNLFLLTDDHNAIGEAKTKFPGYNWMYIDRPRHRGAEGGFENQLPSNNPKFEVVVLLVIFRLVRKCSSLIHTKSGFSDLLRREMGENTVKRVNIDLGKGKIQDLENAKTVNISQSYDPVV